MHIAGRKRKIFCGWIKRRMPHEFLETVRHSIDIGLFERDRRPCFALPCGNSAAQRTHRDRSSAPGNRLFFRECGRGVRLIQDAAVDDCRGERAGGEALRGDVFRRMRFKACNTALIMKIIGYALVFIFERRIRGLLGGRITVVRCRRCPYMGFPRIQRRCVYIG